MASALRAYHRDSWLKELTTRVVSCRPTKKGDIVEVETADTVLFPEGTGVAGVVLLLPLVGIIALILRPLRAPGCRTGGLQAVGSLTTTAHWADFL